MFWLGWEVSGLFNVKTGGGTRETHNTGSVYGDGASELGGMFLDVRPNVFATVRICNVLQLADAARALALGTRGTEYLRADAAGSVIFGWIPVHSIKI